MAGLLDRLKNQGNENVKGRTEAVPERSLRVLTEEERILRENAMAMLEELRVAKDEKQEMTVVFAAVNDQGVMSVRDGLITYRMTMEDGLASRVVDGNLRHRADWIGRDIFVTIKSIEDNGYNVYVNLAAISTVSERIQAIREIDKELARNRVVAGVRGKIINVKQAGVFVELLGSRIMAFCPTRDWSKNYDSALEQILNVGDEYFFDIVGRRTFGQTNAIRSYTLSHRPYTVNKWDGIDRNVVKRGTTLNVRITEVDPERRKFKGVSDNDALVPIEIEIRGEYKAETAEGLRGRGALVPELGHVYQCNITEWVDPAVGYITVALYRPAFSDVQGKAGIYFGRRERVMASEVKAQALKSGGFTDGDKLVLDYDQAEKENQADDAALANKVMEE